MNKDISDHDLLAIGFEGIGNKPTWLRNKFWSHPIVLKVWDNYLKKLLFEIEHSPDQTLITAWPRGVQQ